MKYIVEHVNPTRVSRGIETTETTRVAEVNRIKRMAKQYPGSCVLVSIEKVDAKGKSSKECF